MNEKWRRNLRLRFSVEGFAKVDDESVEYFPTGNFLLKSRPTQNKTN
jgi:hypothetical protein